MQAPLPLRLFPAPDFLAYCITRLRREAFCKLPVGDYAEVEELIQVLVEESVRRAFDSSPSFPLQVDEKCCIQQQVSLPSESGILAAQPEHDQAGQGSLRRWRCEGPTLLRASAQAGVSPS